MRPAWARKRPGDNKSLIGAINYNKAFLRNYPGQLNAYANKRAWIVQANEAIRTMAAMDRLGVKPGNASGIARNWPEPAAIARSSLADAFINCGESENYKIANLETLENNLKQWQNA